jgi:uncharacterized protein (TIGR00661 family)
MNILFGIQGTGNGHISRSIPVIQNLIAKGHHVDVLLSGISNELETPFEIKYRKKGLSYIFGKKGGINLIKTMFHCNILRLIWEIIACPVKKYDLVITDFEPITAWAAKLRKVRSIGFGNQYSARLFPVKTKNIQEKLGMVFLNHFAPASKCIQYDYLQNTNRNIFLPEFHLEEVNAKTMKNRVLVYLPAHSQQSLIKIAQTFQDYTFIAFNKSCKEKIQLLPNLCINPINRARFRQELCKCEKVITAAGFGLTSELIQHGKEMLIVPMKNQVEQKINGEKLYKLGFKVIATLDETAQIESWLKGHQTNHKFPTTDISTITKSLLSLAS